MTDLFCRSCEILFFSFWDFALYIALAWAARGDCDHYPLVRIH